MNARRILGAAVVLVTIHGIPARADVALVVNADNEEADKAFLQVSDCVIGHATANKPPNDDHNQNSENTRSHYATLVRFSQLSTGWQQYPPGVTCGNNLAWLIVLDRSWIYRVENGATSGARKVVVQRMAARAAGVSDRLVRAKWLAAQLAAKEFGREITSCRRACDDFHREWINADGERKEAHRALVALGRPRRGKPPIATSYDRATRLIVDAFLSESGATVESPDGTCPTDWRVTFDRQAPPNEKYQLFCEKRSTRLSGLEKIVYWPVPAGCADPEYSFEPSESGFEFSSDVIVLRQKAKPPERRFLDGKCEQLRDDKVSVKEIVSASKLELAHELPGQLRRSDLDRLVSATSETWYSTKLNSSGQRAARLMHMAVGVQFREPGLPYVVHVRFRPGPPYVSSGFGDNAWLDVPPPTPNVALPKLTDWEILVESK